MTTTLRIVLGLVLALVCGAAGCTHAPGNGGASCGGTSQPCCAGMPCSAGLVCRDDGTCAPCGVLGLLCCATDDGGTGCASGAVCEADDTCAACGAIG